MIFMSLVTLLEKLTILGFSESDNKHYSVALLCANPAFSQLQESLIQT